jgi:hypothetical protein
MKMKRRMRRQGGGVRGGGTLEGEASPRRPGVSSDTCIAASTDDDAEWDEVKRVEKLCCAGSMHGRCGRAPGGRYRRVPERHPASSQRHPANKQRHPANNQ